MSDERRNNFGEDTYDLLHSSFSMNSSSEPDMQAEPDVKNSGEIYFSANSDARSDLLYERADYSSRSTSQRNAAASRQRASDAGATRSFSPPRTGSRTSASSYAPRSSASHSGSRSAASSQSRSSSSSQGRSAASSASRSSSGSGRSASSSAQSTRPRSASSSGSSSRSHSSSAGRSASSGSRDGRSASSSRRSSSGSSSRSARAKESEAYKAPKKKSKQQRREDRKRRGSSFTLAAIVIIFVVIVSFLLRIPIMGCISDIIAINRDSNEVRVTVGENMNTNDVIDLLKENDLIFSAEFCKFIYSLMGHDETEIYPAGTYEVSADMGLEGMLREIITAGATDSTVKITFPEGFTLDQIIEKLASNGVASSSALYAVVDDPSFIEEYDFLAGIDDREQRYHYLEGYMYPDTYEFYIGESPQSVIGRFLKHFNEVWNDEFADRLAKTTYTMDDVITVASILEKEAKDADQMPTIASIIYNRLESSSFPNLQCDSTAKYVENNKSKLVSAGRYASLLKVYDTYQVTGLPVGPISNPGAEAISAALSPENNDYYYFIHDATGEIYTARNQQEHEENMELAGIS